LGLSARTVQAVGERYARSRSQNKLRFLRYRGKDSLGWVPIKAPDLKASSRGFIFAKNEFRVFMSRPIPSGATILDGTSFSKDSCGNWFLNVVLELSDVSVRPLRHAIGIDLGLKDFAALSNGEKIANPRHLAKLADKLAKAQRARKKKLARNLYAKVRNARRDFQHKASTALVKRFDFVAVGNISPIKLAKTRMAKSVLDVSWSSFRDMLRYKAIAHGAVYEEVNEDHSTQVCSSCGCLPKGRPAGIADLGIRTWCCNQCGVTHDRDVNSARNILFASGHRGLVEGTHAYSGEECQAGTPSGFRPN